MLFQKVHSKTFEQEPEQYKAPTTGPTELVTPVHIAHWASMGNISGARQARFSILTHLYQTRGKANITGLFKHKLALQTA